MGSHVEEPYSSAGKSLMTWKVCDSSKPRRLRVLQCRLGVTLGSLVWGRALGDCRPFSVGLDVTAA